METKLTIIILILMLFSYLPLQARAESKNYQHLEGVIKDYYAKEGIDVAIEPHGSRAADILGPNKDGNKIVGEIKKTAEIERDLGGYWSQWNSEQHFGGKTSDYKLANQYTDKGAALSRIGRGWAAVIDGQLRGYCVKELFGRGDLLIENFSGYEKDILQTLDYLKQQGRIKGFAIEPIPNSSMVRIRIVFDKLPTPVVMPTPKETRVGKSPSTSTKEPLKQIEPESVQKGPKLTESKKTINIDYSNKKILPKNESSNPSIKVIQNPSTYSKILHKVVKASVLVSIIISGYTITKEIYEQKMAGKKVHPSRVLARAVTGFAGSFAGGFLLGAFLGFLFSWFPPAGIIAGIIGAIVGGVLGAIGAEWLFELIMPYNGLGWTILDFLFGGILGAIIGIFVGFSIGWTRSFKKGAGFLKRICTLLIIAPFNAIGSALAGLFWGGLFGSILFLIIFNMM
jgi:hypothetical protein